MQRVLFMIVALSLAGAVGATLVLSLLAATSDETVLVEEDDRVESSTLNAVLDNRDVSVLDADESALPLPTVSYDTDLLPAWTGPTGGLTFGWSLPDAFSGSRSVLRGSGDHNGYAVDIGTLHASGSIITDFTPVYSTLNGLVVEAVDQVDENSTKPEYGVFRRIRNAQYACVVEQPMWTIEAPSLLAQSEAAESESAEAGKGIAGIASAFAQETETSQQPQLYFQDEEAQGCQDKYLGSGGTPRQLSPGCELDRLARCQLCDDGNRCLTDSACFRLVDHKSCFAIPGDPDHCEIVKIREPEPGSSCVVTCEGEKPEDYANDPDVVCDTLFTLYRSATYPGGGTVANRLDATFFPLNNNNPSQSDPNGNASLPNEGGATGSNNLPNVGYGKTGNYEVVISHMTEREAGSTEVFCPDGTEVNNRTQCGSMGNTGWTLDSALGKLKSLLSLPFVHYEVWHNPVTGLGDTDTVWKRVDRIEGEEYFVGNPTEPTVPAIPAPCCPPVELKTSNLTGGLSAEFGDGTIAVSPNLDIRLGEDQRLSVGFEICNSSSSDMADANLTFDVSGLPIAGPACYWNCNKQFGQAEGGWHIPLAFQGGHNLWAAQNGAPSCRKVDVSFAYTGGESPDLSAVGLSILGIQGSSQAGFPTHLSFDGQAIEADVEVDSGELENFLDQCNFIPGIDGNAGGARNYEGTLTGDNTQTADRCAGSATLTPSSVAFTAGGASGQIDLISYLGGTGEVTTSMTVGGGTGGREHERFYTTTPLVGGSQSGFIVERRASADAIESATEVLTYDDTTIYFEAKPWVSRLMEVGKSYQADTAASLATTPCCRSAYYGNGGDQTIGLTGIGSMQLATEPAYSDVVRLTVIAGSRIGANYYYARDRGLVAYEQHESSPYTGLICERLVTFE